MQPKRALLALTLLFAALAALPPSAGAISAFTRQYGTECSTCHEPYPALTEFGDAFRKNGYAWPGVDAPLKKPDDMKEAHWVAGIVGSVPLSVSLKHNLLYDDANKDDKLLPDTQAQLHLGGNIKNYVGFFAHDLTTKNAEAFAVVRFQEFAGVPVSVRYGRFIPELSLVKPGLSPFSSPLSAHSLSVAGEPAPGAARNAMEAGWLPLERLYLAAGGADREDQNEPEAYLHAQYRIGGSSYTGREPDVDLDKESVWDYLSVTLGGYGLKGYTKTVDDSFYRAGAEVVVRYKGFTVNAGHLYGKDSKDGDGLEVESVSTFLEGGYNHLSKFQAGFRAEREDQGNAPQGEVKRLTLLGGWSPLQNFWVKAELKYSKAEKGPDRENTTGALLLSYSL